MNKETVLDIYFDNKISPKSLMDFKQKTPEGNYVSGWISKEPGEFLSAMVITEIETPDLVIKCNRFIRGMPKQNYYDEESWNLYQNKEFTIYPCYEKLDGTCLLLYALYDENDELIEIVPRTRGMAVAASHVVDMYKLIDQAQIKKFYSYPHNLDHVLMFELYGILNRHEITYNQYYIDIRLIGATLDRDVLKRQDVLSIAYDYCFMTPDVLFEICSHEDSWKIWGVKSKIYPYYLDKEVLENNTYNSLSDCLDALSGIMETVNENYKKENNHIAIEGVVINGISADKKQRYVKVKPLSVLEMAKLGNGIPNFAIRKETYKYFDEYGIFDVQKLYEEDKLHFVKFIQKNLEEEFPYEYVHSTKTVKKINNIFFTAWEEKTPSITIQNTCQELAEKYPDKSISEIMQIFGKEHPSLKNKSRTVFSILQHLINE